MKIHYTRKFPDRISQMRNPGNKIIIWLLALSSFAGCKKSVQVSAPYTSITETNVYSSDATAIATLNGVYSQMSSSFTTFGISAVSYLSGLSADELTLFSGVSNITQLSYYRNSLASTIAGFEFWNSIYPYIFICNSAIQGINTSSTLTPAVKQQLLGESYFLRAFCYFYLVNLYGDVPVVTTTDYKVNALLTRTPTAKVYQFIISDLKNAQSLLSANYLDGTLLKTSQERVRPTQWAATAMLARIYLYTSDWADAESQATAVINNTSAFRLVGVDTVFLKNNNEAIWQLQPVVGLYNTLDAQLFILPATGPSTVYPVYLSSFLLSQFENGDKRRTHWVDSVSVSGTLYYYPYKYKVYILNSPMTEYEMVLRLGEQYLIRAEARAQQNNLTGNNSATSDINVIRSRAGLSPYSDPLQTDILAEIMHERQIELFTEWGHRWLDLKRVDSANRVMANICPLKGGTWNTNWQLYPLPVNDLQADPNLAQNSGY